MRLAMMLLSGLALSALAGSPALAGGPTAPEEWVGTWEVTQTISDCEGGDDEVDEYLETICLDDQVFDPDLGGQDFTCEGTVDETSFDYVCEATFQIFDCEVTITVDVEGQRSGDTFTASGTIMTVVVAVGELCKPGKSCQEISLVAERVDPDPAECEDVPTETTTWAAIKTRYR